MHRLKTLVDELLDYCPDTGAFTWTGDVPKGGKKRRSLVPGAIDSYGYRQIRIEGKLYLLHRLAHLIMTGEMPNGPMDHINGDPDDNRWCNLRVVSQAENTKNRAKRCDNKTGLPGVTNFRGKYRIKVGSQHIGVSADFFEACCMRISAMNKAGYHENHGRR